WTLINSKCEKILNDSYDEIIEFNENFSIVKEEKTFFIIENSEKKITKIPYEIESVSENLILVKNQNKYFYIDDKVNKINDKKYDQAIKFIDGFAPVCVNNKWGIINKYGKQILDFKYDYIFQNGNDLFKVKNNNKVFFIDLHDNVYLDKVNKKYMLSNFYSDDLLVIKSEKKWGVMNDFFEILFLKKLDFIFPYQDSFAVYKKDNKYGIISKKGKLITGNIFDEILWKNSDYFFVIKNNEYNYFSLKNKKLVF
ncbi:MAG: WG repeat-containing protein, partial [Malacoplasma sp.]|nr:WG repeat-containing protein [Malacoplasma sp.]